MRKNPFTITISNIRKWCYVTFPKYKDKIKKPLPYFMSTWTQKDLFEDFKKTFNVNMLQQENDENIYLARYWVSKYSALFVDIFHNSALSNIEKSRYWKYFMSSDELAAKAISISDKITIVERSNVDKNSIHKYIAFRLQDLYEENL